MDLLPQAWIVLSVFVLCILTNLFFTLFNKEYRRAVFKDSTNEILTYFAQIFVMGIVLTYSVQCSLRGSLVMPSCNVFTWILSSLIVLLFIYSLVTKLNTYVFKDDKNKKKKLTAQEIEDEEERFL